MLDQGAIALIRTTLARDVVSILITCLRLVAPSASGSGSGPGSGTRPGAAQTHRGGRETMLDLS